MNSNYVACIQKEVSSLKLENKNLKRLLLRQGSAASTDDDTAMTVHQSSQDGSVGSVILRQKAAAASRPKDVRCLSLGSSFHSTVSPSSPGPHLVQKYSLGNLDGLGITFLHDSLFFFLCSGFSGRAFCLRQTPVSSICFNSN